MQSTIRVLAATSLAIALCATACAGSKTSEAERVAAGVEFAVGAASKHARPVACARPVGAVRALELPIASERAVIGVVADARGGGEVASRAMTRAAAVFKQAGVDVVIGAGGVGATSQELAALYKPLVGAAKVVVIAAGDRERADAVAAAAASLGDSVHGAAEPLIVRAGALAIAVAPGVREPSQQVSGAAGCAYSGADVAALARTLANVDADRVWLSFAPPRQRGERASDLSEGVHVGDAAMADAVAVAKPALAVHAWIDPPAAAIATGSGTVAAPAFVAVGPVVDSGTTGPVVPGFAVIVTDTDDGVSWRREQLIGATPSQ